MDRENCDAAVLGGRKVGQDWATELNFRSSSFQGGECPGLLQEGEPLGILSGTRKGSLEKGGPPGREPCKQKLSGWIGGSEARRC